MFVDSTWLFPSFAWTRTSVFQVAASAFPRKYGSRTKVALQVEVVADVSLQASAPVLHSVGVSIPAGASALEPRHTEMFASG